jgi:hypothetical protein
VEIAGMAALLAVVLRDLPVLGGTAEVRRLDTETAANCGQ